jgi:hypothetical protein
MFDVFDRHGYNVTRYVTDYKFFLYDETRRFSMIRKTTNGYYLVTLPLSEEFMRMAMDHWERLSYSGPEDYLSGILNMGILREMDANHEYEKAVDEANGIKRPQPAPPVPGEDLPF